MGEKGWCRGRRAIGPPLVSWDRCAIGPAFFPWPDRFCPGEWNGGIKVENERSERRIGKTNNCTPSWVLDRGLARTRPVISKRAIFLGAANEIFSARVQVSSLVLAVWADSSGAVKSQDLLKSLPVYPAHTHTHSFATTAEDIGLLEEEVWSESEVLPDLPWPVQIHWK